MKNYNLQDIGGKELIEQISKDKTDILLTAPTGSGKSYFIRHMFYNYCKEHRYKVLYLLPRTAPLKQFELELLKENKITADENERYYDTMQLRTYQEIEISYAPKETTAEEEQRQPINLNRYKFIVCDECHYFTQDSTFNKHTYISYREILAAKPQKIYISATPQLFQIPNYNINGKSFQEVLNDTTFTKEIPIVNAQLRKPPATVEYIQLTNLPPEERTDNYKTYISKILDKIPEEEKAIIFCGNIATIRELKKLYKNSTVIYSAYNESNSNHISKKEREQVEKSKAALFDTGKFDTQFLFTTNVLDVGFSITDRAVKHIICTLTDITSIIQAVGRKRSEDITDRYRVYLPDVNNRQLPKRIEKAVKNLEHAVYFMDKGEIEYLRKYEQQPDPTQTVYTAYKETTTDTGEIQHQVYTAINPQKLRYYKHTLDRLKEIDSIKSQNKYAYFLSQIFGTRYNFTKSAKDIQKEEEQQIQEQEIYKQLLQWIEENKVCTTKTKSELVKAINYKEKSKQVKDIKRLSEYTKEKYNIEIITATTKETVTENGKEKKKQITIYYLEQIE